MNRLRTRLARAEVRLPAPPPIIVTEDHHRMAAFWQKHPRLEEFNAAWARVWASGPRDYGRLLEDPEASAVYDELRQDFWRSEYAARALRGTPCHCTSFEHPACRPGAPADLAAHQRLVVDFALWLVPVSAKQLIADRPQLMRFVGRLLNNHCDKFGPDRVTHLRNVLTRGSYQRPIPADVVTWAAQSFAGFVARTGNTDAIAWLQALYRGEVHA